MKTPTPAAISPRFAELLDHLETVSRSCGPGVLVEALTECAAGVSQDFLDCPLGAMLLDEYRLSRRGRSPIALDREALVTRVLEFLEGRARLAADAVYVDAILACEEAMRERRACPVFRAVDRLRVPRPGPDTD